MDNADATSIAADGKAPSHKRQVNDVEYITREEALAVLGVKKESLYTYVSRGLIKTAPHAESRRKRYLKTDVEKLRSRSGERAKESRVSQSLRYGEPVVQSWICDITPAGPRYRGHLAIDLAKERRSFEYVADLIWTGVPKVRDMPWEGDALPEGIANLARLAHPAGARDAILATLSMLATRMSGMGGISEEAMRHDPVSTGSRLVRVFAGAAGLLGPGRRYTGIKTGEAIAECVARGFGIKPTPDAIRALNCALVLSADNELSAPTFAARICASTGADLEACVASAVLVQSGPMQVGGAHDVEELFDTLLERTAASTALPRGYSAKDLPCFNHPMYARDPRAAFLVDLAAEVGSGNPRLSPILAFIERIDKAHRQYPNIFAALVVLAVALDLPKGSAALLHTVGRTAGWLAHASEQKLTGAMLRPRARYMGSAQGA